ncbi:outer membrane protein [Pustulibacterium marinum]|uniref:Outer membrane protein n=1 Tax=Pustulibacterium marinum TaxID=1224947 RepID=A0A1I7H9T6_9FLAO|nr:TolC family protein [Pustulibacterium marinum]SFU57444.1 outer membrane protein [Pustulibacterium marinum]
MQYAIQFKRSVFLLCLFAISFVNAQEKKWTLVECVNYALENNISVKQSTLDLETTDVDILSAKGNFLPSLSASGSYSSNTGANQDPTTNTIINQTFASFSANVGGGVNLFSGLSAWKNFQRAKLNKIASQYALDGMKDDVVLMVANAYLQILFNKEQLKVLKAQNQLTKENIERTQELINAGSLPAGDIYELQATDASQEQAIISSENALLISRVGLAQTLLVKDYMNFDIADEEFDVPEDADVLTKSPQQISEKAKEVLNTLKIAEANLDVAEKDVEVARSGYYPSLSAFANYNTRWSESPYFSFREQLYLFDGLSVGLQLSVPILNGFNTRAQVQRSKINVLRAEYTLEQSELDLEKNVYQAYMDASNARKLYEASLKTLEARQQAYNFSTERFNVGLLNSYDFNQSKTEFESAQSDVVQNKYDYIFKLKVLEFYFGIPITAN